ncbi:MAG TPA: DNA primase [Clostridia bacterium]|nr:DNA primase [Clostridia bacterium]
MAISEEFLQELRERVDIETVISPYVNLRRRGRLMTGLCPFHNEKTPSFTVYTDTQSFYCFGCGAGGEIITFVRRIENLDFIEAVKTLAQKAGMQMPEDGYDDSLSKRRNSILAANREAAKFFNETLMSPKGKVAAEYLHNRGVSPAITKRFGLGCAPDAWDGLLKHMRQKGYSAQDLIEANLARKSTKGDRTNIYDNFRNRLMIPIIDLRGNVIAFGGRVLDDSKLKYVNTSDTFVYKKSQNVFALNFAKNGNDGKLILAEGYMDVIALHQAGFTNAVACLGTALTGEQAQLISRYASEVILAYDSDAAGQAATQKSINILNRTGIKIRVLSLSGGKDPDEILKKPGGTDRFRNLLDGAANDIEYKLLHEREKFDTATPDGKLNFLKAAVPVIARLQGAIERDIYASSLSQELSVDKEAILMQVKQHNKKMGRVWDKERFKAAKREVAGYSDKINIQRGGKTRATKAEEVLITTLLNNPDFYKKISEKVGPNDFMTDFNKRLFELLFTRLHDGKSIDLTLLSGSFTAEEMSKVTALYVKGAEITNTLTECEDCIAVLAEEKESLEVVNPAELSDEEFSKLFQKKDK